MSVNSYNFVTYKHDHLNTVVYVFDIIRSTFSIPKAINLDYLQV